MYAFALFIHHWLVSPCSWSPDSVASITKDEPNILRYFKQDGYQVHWWGKNDLLAPESYADAVTEHHRPAIRGKGRSEDLFSLGEEGYYSFLRGPADGEFFERTAAEDCVSMLGAASGI